MSTFHTSFLLRKSTATLLPTRYVLTINESFHMRYCASLYLFEAFNMARYFKNIFLIWINVNRLCWHVGLEFWTTNSFICPKSTNLTTWQFCFTTLYRVSHTYLTKVILLEMTLNCTAYLKSMHFCNHKDPPFDMNHQLMSADQRFVVNFDMKQRNWFLLFFLSFSTRNMDFFENEIMEHGPGEVG